MLLIFLPCHTFLSSFLPAKHVKYSLSHNTELKCSFYDFLVCPLILRDSFFFFLPKWSSQSTVHTPFTVLITWYTMICMSLAGHSLKLGTNTWSFFFLIKEPHIEETKYIFRLLDNTILKCSQKSHNDFSFL